MKIAVDGPLRDGDGYSTAARGVIVGLSRLGVEVGTEDNWHCRAEWLEPEVELALTRGFEGSDFALRLSQPDSGEMARGKAKVCWSMWEFTEVPRAKYRGPDAERIISWPDGMNRVDAHFVPCRHSYDLWQAAGCKKPVFIVPFGFDPERYYWCERDSARPFTFAISGTLSGRKNPQMVLAAFTELFGGNPEARLLIKSWPHLAFHHPDLPDNVQIFNEFWDADRFREFYAESDILAYPTQGEGFGLPIVESMATGLAPIVTAWSAPLDYIDDSVGWPLDYDIEYVGSDYCLDPVAKTYQEFGYAQPRYEHLLEIMAHCFEHRQEVREKGREACLRVFGRYTWGQVGREILKALSQITQ